MVFYMSKHIRNTLAVFTDVFKSIHIEEDEILQVTSSLAFLHLFDDVDDFRIYKKTKYKLSNLLLLILLVIIKEKACSCYHIATIIRFDKSYYAKLGLLEDDQCPSHDTLRRVLMMLDPATLQESTLHSFYDFLLGLEKLMQNKDDIKHYALDGKEVRGTGRANGTHHPGRNIALLNIYDSGLYTCLTSIPIHEKTNEIPVSQELLEGLNLKKIMITADALHCQRKTADIIQRKKGYYLLTVRENQGLLLKEIEARFQNKKSKIINLNREKRSIQIVHLPKSYGVDGFTGMKSFVKMISSTRKGKTIRYFITNTTDEEMIFDAIESRWSIENDLHKEKDTYLDEDHIRYTNKEIVQNMAILNNLIIQIVRVYQAMVEPNFKAAKIKLHLHPEECLNVLLHIMSSEEIIKEVKNRIRKIAK